MDTDDLALMEARVAEARRLIAEARALGEDTSDVEPLVVQLELLLADLRLANAEHSAGREAS
jgi:hypothetical protein